MLPRLIATDLDGTFLLPDGTISDLNRRAVQRAVDAGITVVFATGRPPTWLGGDIASMDIAHPVIVACNGALLFDAGTREVLRDWPVDPEVCLEIADGIRRRLPGVAFGIQQAFAFGHEPEYFSHPPRPVRNEWFSGPLDELVHAGRCVKMLVHHPGIRSTELAAVAEEVADGRVTITYSMDNEQGLLEISAPGVTKAHTLATVTAKLGISPEEVAAFGDMANDREMLKWAGMPFVMGNAHESLADLPATRIGSNAESAVGRTILEWLDGSQDG